MDILIIWGLTVSYIYYRLCKTNGDFPYAERPYAAFEEI